MSSLSYTPLATMGEVGLSPVLIAEDNEDDLELIQLVLRKAGVSNPVHIVRDGEEALAYISGSGKYADRCVYPVPELALLDLRLPGVNGFEILEWVRRSPALAGLKVVILTGSEEVRNVNRAYQLGANAFIIKPPEMAEFVQMAALLKQRELSGRGPMPESRVESP
jgi:CheY-like chemotaxis protein